MKSSMGKSLLAALVVFAATSVCSTSASSAGVVGGVSSRPTSLLHNDKKNELAALKGDALRTAAVGLAGGQEVRKRRSSVGVLGVLGGALCHLVLGTTYCWGNFGPYMPAKLKFFSGVDSGGAPDSSFVLPGAFVAQTLTMPLGPYFQQKLGCRNTTALGCAIMALGVFLSSFATNLYAFMFCYSFLFGAGVGLAYTAPMVNGWKWFPDKKGLVSGAVVAGFGSGGFVFNQVGTKIINPKGLNPSGGVYPDEIYANFPVMLRRLSYIYVVLAAIGSMAIKAPPAADSGKEVRFGKKVVKTQAEGLSLGEALKTRNFWLMWFMVLMIATSGINVANNYKAFGTTVKALQSDQFQSIVGSMAALCNGAGRLFWGNMLDVFGFKSMFSTLAAIQTAVTASYSTMAQTKFGFLVSTGMLLFCLGGNFAMFPAVTSKVFGVREGAKIYGVVFSAFALASIVGSKLTKVLVEMDWEWDHVFKLMAGLSLCSLAALPMFKV